jgi:hypothetical protein
MRKVLVFILIMFTGYFLSAQVYDETDEEHPKITGEIAEAIDDYYSYDVSIKGEPWKKGRSSVLIEKGKAEDIYELSKLNDNDLSTAWVEGVKGNGIGEYVLRNIWKKAGNGFESFNYRIERDVNIVLEVNNGFCKSEALFKKNNRIKKARIIIYDAPLVVGQNYTYVESDPVVLYDTVIELQDIMEQQKFEFAIKLRDDYHYSEPEVLLKFTILDVYKGTAYDDTCISEMHVYGEYEDKE